MKIYTKTGDKGQTSLIGGTRVPKHHIRIESYGTIDELNSHLGLIRDTVDDKEVINQILEIQDRLFTMGSILASDPGKAKMKIPELIEDDVVFLEKAIDKMNETLPEMRSFVLPGGSQIISFIHLARCVCRRAERNTIRLSEESKVDDIVIKYLNRLSDYLFVLSRKLTFDTNAVEIPWKARM